MMPNSNQIACKHLSRNQINIILTVRIDIWSLSTHLAIRPHAMETKKSHFESWPQIFGAETELGENYTEELYRFKPDDPPKSVASSCGISSFLQSNDVISSRGGLAPRYPRVRRQVQCIWRVLSMQSPIGPRNDIRA